MTTKKDVSSERDRVLKALESTKYGALFELSSWEGHIGSYETRHFDVTMYSNVCGEYADELVVQVTGMPVVRVPIRVRVVGVPLVLHPHTVGLTPGLY